MSMSIFLGSNSSTVLLLNNHWVSHSLCSPFCVTLYVKTFVAVYVNSKIPPTQTLLYVYVTLNLAFPNYSTYSYSWSFTTDYKEPDQHWLLGWSSQLIMTNSSVIKPETSPHSQTWSARMSVWMPGLPSPSHIHYNSFLSLNDDDESTKNMNLTKNPGALESDKKILLY